MKRFIPQKLAIIFIIMTFFNSCQKDIGSLQNNNESDSKSFEFNHGRSNQTKNYSADVVTKWIDMQLRLYRTNPTPIGGAPPSRYYAYSAIALYEAVLPGMPSYRSLSGQLTDMPDMPEIEKRNSYFWPASGNAALAAITRSFFPNTTAANKASVDSLENVLYEAYSLLRDKEVLQRSADFGKSVAQLVFNWSNSDGAANANAPYTPLVGPGLWVPTPPAFAPAFGPFWGNNRLMVKNSLYRVAPQAPPAYSTDPSSDYYKMVKEVYDISQSLTPEQLAIAVFWRDSPGFGGGHYLSVFNQVLLKNKPNLDFAAYAFVKTGMAIYDGGIGCFRTKYQYNQERPVTFIRGVLGYASWNSAIVAPPFPDFPSAHSVAAGAFTEMMNGLFGSHYHFTDHSYDYLGMKPRTYSSFDAMAQEIGDARLFGGIHNRISCVRGLEMGKKIAKNINKNMDILR